MLRCRLVPVVLLATLVTVGATVLATDRAWAEPVTVKVRDAVRVKGANANPLMGYGLVVGLNGTGDSSSALQTDRMAANMLRIAGLRLDEQKLRLRNVAAVIVTASLPPYAQSGDPLDVLVSSIGDARSLRGGTLLLTPLEAADGSVWAEAQGPLSTGTDSSGRSRDLLAGRIPVGGLVLHDMSTTVAHDGHMTLILKEPDYATAERLRSLVATQGGVAVRVTGPATIDVALNGTSESALMAHVGDLDLPVESAARVVFNERTGTVVMGGDIRLSPVAVSRGALKVRVAEGPVRQASLDDRSRGTPPALGVMAGSGTLQELVDALNDLGATPAEMMQILQALKAAGALKAELEIQ